jgi:hypothetical protein
LVRQAGRGDGRNASHDLTVNADATPQTVLSHSHASVAPGVVFIQPPSAGCADETQCQALPLCRLSLSGVCLPRLRSGERVLRPRLRGTGSPGVAATRRISLPFDSPGSPGQRRTPAPVPGASKTKSNASGFPRGGGACSTSTGIEQTGKSSGLRAPPCQCGDLLPILWS